MDKWGDVDRYITDQLVQSDAALEQALIDARAAGLPAHDVSPPQGKMLYILALMMSAKRILELGTLGGYSAIWMARALPADGKLITLEAKQNHADVARKNLERAGVSQLVDIRVGSAIDTLPLLSNEAPFDMFFIDADKPNNAHYFEYALKYSKPGSLMVFDNVIRNGDIMLTDTRSDGVIGLRRMNELIAAEPRVTATTIQTVGLKGYDGFTLVRVK